MIRDGASKIWQRFLSAAGELGEVVLGDRMEAKLDQEIRMTDLEIKRTRDEEQAAKARRVNAKSQADGAKREQEQIEQDIAKLLRGRRKSQAHVKAVEAARLAGDAMEWERQAQLAGDEQARMAQTVEHLLRRLALLKQQMGSLKAAANLQRTQAAIMSAEGTLPDTAQAAARRLRQGQEKQFEQSTAPTKMSETADEIIARIQKKTAPKSSNPATPSRNRSTR